MSRINHWLKIWFKLINSFDSNYFDIYEQFKIQHSVELCIKRFYHNDPKFSDKQVWANSADPDQTAPLGAV